jgi:hypothetical protein
LRESLSRYLFYGWLFHDADAGSHLERAAALRHNSDQAKWLPTYMRRWAFLVTGLLALEALSERALSTPLISAALSVAVILALVFILLTAICWAFLQSDRRSR